MSSDFPNEETKLLDSFVLVPGVNKVLCRIESGEGSGRKNKTLVVQPTADDFESFEMEMTWIIDSD